MRQITLNIEEKNLGPFLAFIKTLDYVTISDPEQVNEWQQEEVKRWNW